MTAPVWVEIAVSLGALLGNGFFLYQAAPSLSCAAFRSSVEGSASGYPGPGLLHDHLGGGSQPALYVSRFRGFTACVQQRGPRGPAGGGPHFLLSLIMSVSALLDTYLFDADTMLTRVSRTAVFGLLFLLLRRHLPQEVVALPRRLWNLILALAMMPRAL